jgi:hypothetical protein
MHLKIKGGYLKNFDKRNHQTGGNNHAHDGNGKSHPRHRNGQSVEKGKCQRCVIIDGDAVVTEIEEHHEIPKMYGGAGGPRRKGCPDCHMLVHELIDEYVRIVIADNIPAILEINRRHFAGENLTTGDLRKIAIEHSKESQQNIKEVES